MRTSRLVKSSSGLNLVSTASQPLEPLGEGHDAHHPRHLHLPRHLAVYLRRETRLALRQNLPSLGHKLAEQSRVSEIQSLEKLLIDLFASHGSALGFLRRREHLHLELIQARRQVIRLVRLPRIVDAIRRDAIQFELGQVHALKRMHTAAARPLPPAAIAAAPTGG